MRTMHSVLKHGGLYWDRSVVPPDACDQRYARLQQAIAASGDDAWLLYGDIERHGNLTFATNFLPRVRSALCFVPRQGKPIFLANIGLRDVPAAKTITWVEDMRPFGRLPKALIDLLAERGLQSARLGTCGFDRSLPIAEWEAIEKGLPQATWTSRDEAITKLRGAKEDFEIAAIRRSAEIADSALRLAEGVLRPGVTMRQAIAAIDRKVRRRGAEDARYLIGFGAGSIRPVDDRPLAAGDILTLYVAVETQRYWAESTRSFVLGPAKAEMRDLFARGERALAAMHTVARAGVPAAELARAVRSALADEELYRTATLYGLGHGIGLDAEEDPAITESNTSPLIENATLATRVILRRGDIGIGLSQILTIRAGRAEEIDKPASLVEMPI